MAHKKATIVSQGYLLMAVYCATALAHHGCGLPGLTRPGYFSREQSACVIVDDGRNRTSALHRVIAGISYRIESPACCSTH